MSLWIPFFLQLSNIPLCMCTTFSLSILCWWTCRLFPCPVNYIINGAVMNIEVSVLVWIMVFSGYMPSSGSHGSSSFSFFNETLYCNHKSSHKRKTRGSVVKKNVLMNGDTTWGMEAADRAKQGTEQILLQSFQKKHGSADTLVLSLVNLFQTSDY